MKLSKKDLATGILYLGLTVSMMGGATWPSPRGWVVAVGIAILIVGVFIKRQADRAIPMAAEGLAEGAQPQGSVASARALLPELLEAVKALEGTASQRDLPAIAGEIDALQTHKVAAIAASQEDFVRRHGFAGYASMMAPLATAERLLYRAWSAASDGHRPEMVGALRDAIPYLEEADRALREVKGT